MLVEQKSKQMAIDNKPKPMSSPINNPAPAIFVRGRYDKSIIFFDASFSIFGQPLTTFHVRKFTLPINMVTKI